MINSEIISAYVGSDQVERLYLGSEVVWEMTQPTQPEPVEPSGDTPYVVVDGTRINLRDTVGDMYEYIFAGAYTSITLYYHNEVVTASTLTISVDGNRTAYETDYEVANIDGNTYGASSLNTISFNVASNDVYIDFFI